ncbi:MAG: response regulator [Rubripirellula sp.]|nr:response regulator [Rubripirellula sp.]
MNASASERPHILLVDDEPEILHSLKGLLRREFTLHTAETGPQALEILRQHAIQVIMTDQRMPQMTGAQLLGQAKAISPDTIRILFTGYADIKAVVDAVNQGQVYRYLTKPWDPDELVDLLSSATAEHQQRKKLQAILETASGLCERISNSELAGGFREECDQLADQIKRLSDG